MLRITQLVSGGWVEDWKPGLPVTKCAAFSKWRSIREMRKEEREVIKGKERCVTQAIFQPLTLTC